MSCAWMFPGQGSQYVGMGRRLLAEFPAARQIVEEASQLSGFDLDRVRATGPVSQLSRPEIAEPLLAATQVAYAYLLLESGALPEVIAGYSAGEVAAYYAAGVLSRTDALKAAVIRGRVLSQYVSDANSMIAVSHVEHRTVEMVLKQFNTIEFAGKNAPDHSTLVGPQEAIQQFAAEISRHRGTITPVNVAGPWHSQRLRSASDEIFNQLQTLNFASPSVEVYTSLAGEQTSEPLQLAAYLALQVSNPVQWQDVLRRWRERGVRHLIEVGGGRVLLGLLRRNWLDFDSYKVECVEAANGSIAPFKRLLNASTTRTTP